MTTAARTVGFTEVAFQFEPIAAALDYESTIDHEQLVLVADIGGGTSDFSIVRVGPQQREKLDRKNDILANHGIHLAGTDFDFAVNLAAIMPTLGLGSLGPLDQGARRVRGYRDPGPRLCGSHRRSRHRESADFRSEPTLRATLQNHLFSLGQSC